MRQWKRVHTALAAALAAAALLFIYIVNPLENLGWLHCPVYWSTGFYCPGCGSLRAAHAILKGEFIAALQTNPLATLFLPVLVGIGIRSAFQSLRGESCTLRIHPVVAWSVFGIIILFTVLRNLPFESLYVLRP